MRHRAALPGFSGRSHRSTCCPPRVGVRRKGSSATKAPVRMASAVSLRWDDDLFRGSSFRFRAPVRVIGRQAAASYLRTGSFRGGLR